MTEEKPKQKKYDQHMRHQAYGDDIEKVVRKIMGINYSGKEGGEKFVLFEIDASDCAKHPFLTIKARLFYYLALHPNKSQSVIGFIQKYPRVVDMSTYDILSFVTKDNKIDNFTLRENGEEYLEKMIEDFEAIVK